jgi:aminoglycoside phosphotransferase (APT) family kinase protein
VQAPKPGAAFDPMQSRLVDQINARYRTSFRALGRYPVGENGAFRLVDSAGARFVLKWSARHEHVALFRAAATIADQLRPLGYPTPRYVLCGSLGEGSFGVQRALPGRPGPITNPAAVNQLVALNDLHVDRGGWLAGAFPARPAWAEEVVRAVTDGYAEHNYCVLESLATYSTATAHLLDVLQTFVKLHADEVGARDQNDIVHFDYSPANILFAGGRLVGVVDWEGVRAGDRLFDLATLLFYTCPMPDVQHRLWELALERGQPGVLGVYLAHMLVRQVDFSIRHHGSEAVDQWQTYARSLVANIEATSR